MFIENFKVESPNVKYTETEIQSVYNYETTEVVHENRNGTYQWVVKPKTVKYEFKTETHVPKLGVMLVGWGGNNGSTLTGGLLLIERVFHGQRRIIFNKPITLVLLLKLLLFVLDLFKERKFMLPSRVCFQWSTLITLFLVDGISVT